ncbi:MAG: hypothetical protein A3B37_00360 [Candidatus Sungbacteria bacterium RIFCSPLOWO2_01_FULL_59_16]|uniref:Uncharacterized protein n=1 Tax=Candidatus Sungbacteria bacterium RIFCSPLOWO2_01_FULL_59_16 TaxID=1802280 RepID=A0A1G2LDA5_9BACT|nr:MAG: hypothetical protein A3B37_00360 [Candidatus Sungbacteria bacterium RIFCSPLOWO2_01_FULL_59_16]
MGRCFDSKCPVFEWEGGNGEGGELPEIPFTYHSYLWHADLVMPPLMRCKEFLAHAFTYCAGTLDPETDCRMLAHIDPRNVYGDCKRCRQALLDGMEG